MRSTRFNAEAMMAVFDAALEGIVICDEAGSIQTVNVAAEKLFGYVESELVDRNVRILMPEAVAEHHGAYVKRYLATGERHILGTVSEFVGARKDGSTIPLRLSLSEFFTEGRRYFLGVCSDMTEELEFSERISWMATHDQLTGALNRHGAIQVLDEMIETHREAGSGLAVLFIDLDGFKRINDNHGHHIGDELLGLVVERLRRQLRDGDTERDRDRLARVGGDEFMALLSIGSRPHEAEEVAARIVEALREPFEVGDRMLTLGASVGISLFPDHGDSPDELMNRADMAMYHVKRGSGSAVWMFDRALKETAEAEYVLVDRLQEAIEAERFVLHYQLQVDIATGEPVGMEALLRWQDPEQGLIMPDSFLGTAIEYGMMTRIGRWVLRQACEDNVRLRRLGLLDGRVAVNMDAPMFNDATFVPLVRDALVETGLPSSRLEIEVIESVAMTPSAQLTRNTRELIEMGVTIAMDDFGTGYSSLRQLKDQQFSRLKIDRSFVARLPGSFRDGAIVSAMLYIAHGLGMEAVAEGIETEDQWTFLKRQGCQAGQGYLFARPMAFDALVERLRPLSQPPDAAQDASAGRR